MLTAAGAHPWPQPLAAAWIGRLYRRGPQPYVQVEPLLVAEIVVHQAYDRGRLRHPVHHLRGFLTMTPRNPAVRGGQGRAAWESFPEAALACLTDQVA
jgi:hypothetical protein